MREVGGCKGESGYHLKSARKTWKCGADCEVFWEGGWCAGRCGIAAMPPELIPLATSVFNSHGRPAPRSVISLAWVARRGGADAAPSPHPGRASRTPAEFARPFSTGCAPPRRLCSTRGYTPASRSGRRKPRDAEAGAGGRGCRSSRRGVSGAPGLWVRPFVAHLWCSGADRGDWVSGVATPGSVRLPLRGGAEGMVGRRAAARPVLSPPRVWHTFARSFPALAARLIAFEPAPERTTHEL